MSMRIVFANIPLKEGCHKSTQLIWQTGIHRQTILHFARFPIISHRHLSKLPWFQSNEWSCLLSENRFIEFFPPWIIHLNCKMSKPLKQELTENIYKWKMLDLLNMFCCGCCLPIQIWFVTATRIRWFIK